LSQQRQPLELVPNGIVIGSELAKNLGIPVGAHVTLITAPDRQQRVRVTAFYDSGIRAIDQSASFVNLTLAQALLRRPDQVNGIAVRVRDANAAPALAAELQSATGLRARSWQELNAVFFGVFRLQNTLTGMMIAFIVVISGFGITNGLITLILEKQRDIGILKALGTPAAQIVRIFLLEGIVMGFTGAVLGMSLALFTIDYLSHLPLHGQGGLTTATTFTMLRGPLVYLVPGLLAIAVSVIASIFPVRRAARYDPVTIIRSAK